ncbi:MAG TPA: TadE/TadG family type IV pilus assembly protein [Acidimicrobiales bacterium]|nr:TadE/TadG family type IV pilus assembly protein [Acidimicrobiales bacterium]
MSRRREDGGQAAVELALVLPLVALLLLAVVQVALVLRAQLLVAHAAREAVRAAAVDPDPDAALVAALAAGPLPVDRVTVRVTDAGDGRVRVDVEHRAATDLPLVGALIGDVTLRGSATMRIEHRPP